MDNITADEMRKLSVNKDNEELNSILGKIKNAATAGKYSIYLSNFGISKVHRENLESRGFSVKVGGRYNEINTTINWS